MTQTLDDLATQLIAAHDGGTPIAAVPHALVPVDMAGVYRMQDVVIGQLGPVGGWKVMAGGKGDPTCAPIPANRYFANGARLQSARHRFILAEVEVAVVLGRDLLAGANTGTVEAAIASIHPVIEMVASPFVDRDTIDAKVRLGDLQSNGAVVVGPALDTAIKSELAALNVTLLLDGIEAKSGAAGASWSEIVAAIGWLASHAGSRGMPLVAGQVIITGARALAPHGVASVIEGRVGEWGAATAEMSY